jgi:hypothetical protein
VVIVPEVVRGEEVSLLTIALVSVVLLVIVPDVSVKLVVELIPDVAVAEDALEVASVNVVLL